MSEYGLELILEAVIVVSLLVFSLVYAISCTRWSRRLERKVRDLPEKADRLLEEDKKK